MFHAVYLSFSCLCKTFLSCKYLEHQCREKTIHRIIIHTHTVLAYYVSDYVLSKISSLEMSGVYMLFRVVLVIVNYHDVDQIGWLLHALMFLSLSILILVVQPYKKSYMNVRWLVASSNGVSHSTACHIPVHPAIVE